MIEKIEKYVMYRAVLDLIAHDEAYDKKKNILNSEEVLKLCHDRYLFMKEMLNPLKEKLGRDIEILDISFVQGKDDTCIIVKYLNDGKKSDLTMSHLEFDNFETICNTSDKQIMQIISDNKEEVLKTFDDAYHYSFDKELCIPSTSKHFVITDDNETFSLKDFLNGDAINLNLDHASYEIEKLICVAKNNISHYKNLNKVLMNDEKIREVFEHTKVYEENLPKVLIKK